MKSYDIGDTVRVDSQFKVDSVLTDPTATTLKVKTPSGVVTQYIYGSGDGIIIKDSTGKFHADLIMTEAGVWTYRWQGTGTAAAAEEVQFKVRKSNFPSV